MALGDIQTQAEQSTSVQLPDEKLTWHVTATFGDITLWASDGEHDIPVAEVGSDNRLHRVGHKKRESARLLVKTGLETEPTMLGLMIADGTELEFQAMYKEMKRFRMPEPPEASPPVGL